MCCRPPQQRCQAAKTSCLYLNLSSCVPVKRTARIGGQGRRQAAAAAPAAADIIVGVVPRRHAALHAAPTSSLLHNICILCERCISPIT